MSCKNTVKLYRQQYKFPAVYVNIIKLISEWHLPFIVLDRENR